MIIATDLVVPFTFRLICPSWINIIARHKITTHFLIFIQIYSLYTQPSVRLDGSQPSLQANLIQCKDGSNRVEGRKQRNATGKQSAPMATLQTVWFCLR